MLINGHAVATGRATIDLTKPVAVRIVDAPPADHVELSLDMLGVSAKSVSARVRRVGTTDRRRCRRWAARYFFGGNFTGQLTLLRAGRTVGTRQFGVSLVQSALLSALAVLDVLLLLFSLAYVESFLRTLRRSRARISATVGAPIAAVVVGRRRARRNLDPRRSRAHGRHRRGVPRPGRAAGVAAVIAARRIGRRRRRTPADPLERDTPNGHAHAALQEQQWSMTVRMAADRSTKPPARLLGLGPGFSGRLER